MLDALAAVGEVVGLVDELAEVVTGGGPAFRLGFLVPLAPAIGSADEGLDGTSLPRGAVIQDRSLESRFQPLVRRFSHRLPMPGRPVREAAFGQFITFNHLLRRRAVATALLTDEFVVAARGIVEIEVVRNAVGIRETVLEDGLRVARRHRDGESVSVVGHQGVTKSGEFIGRRDHLVVLAGIEHGAGNQGQGDAPVQPAFRSSLFRQVPRREVQVVPDEVPAVGLGGKGFLHGNLGQVLIVEDDFLVAFHQLEIQPAAHQAEFAHQTGLIRLRKVRPEGLEIRDGLVRPADRIVQGTPATQINAHETVRQVRSAIGHLAGNQTHREIDIGPVLELVREGLGHTHAGGPGREDVIRVGVDGIDGVLGALGIGPHHLVGDAVGRGHVQETVAGGQDTCERKGNENLFHKASWFRG